MWLFDLLDANESVTSTVPVAEGIHTLGRKGASISFPDDRSVSRKHAEVRVGRAGNEPGNQPIWVKDVGSKLKTFVNGTDTGEAQAEVTLKDGDKVKLGTTNSVMRLRYQALRLCGTSLSPEEKAELKKLCKRCGGSVARKWEAGGRCTHLVSPAVATVTEKLVLAAAEGRPTVHLGWLRDLAAAGTAKPLRAVPDTVPFVSIVKRGRGLFPIKKDADRRTHLSGEFLVALYKEDVVEKMVETTGGSLCRAYAMSDDDFAGQDWQDWAAGRKSHFVQPVEGQPLITPEQRAMVDSRGATLERLGIEATNKQQLAEAVLFLQPLISIAEAAVQASSSAAAMRATASEAWGPSQPAASQAPQASLSSHAPRPAAAEAATTVVTDLAMPAPTTGTSNSRGLPKPTGVDGVDADAGAGADAGAPTSAAPAVPEATKSKGKAVPDSTKADGKGGDRAVAGGDSDDEKAAVSGEPTENATIAAAPSKKKMAPTGRKKRDREEREGEERQGEDEEGEEKKKKKKPTRGARASTAVGGGDKNGEPRGHEEAEAAKSDAAVAAADADGEEGAAGGAAQKGGSNGDGDLGDGGDGGDSGGGGGDRGEGGSGSGGREGRPTKRGKDAQPPRQREGGAEENGQQARQGEGNQEIEEEQNAEDGGEKDEAAGQRRGRDSQRSNSGAPAPAPAKTSAPGGWMTAHNAVQSSQKEKRLGEGARAGAGAGIGAGRGRSQGGRGKGRGGAEDDAPLGEGSGGEGEDERAQLEAPLEAAVTEKCRLVVRAYSRAVTPKGCSGTSVSAGSRGRRGSQLPNFKRFKKNTIMYGGETVDGYVPMTALRSTLPKESERELVLAAEQQRLEEEEADADRLFTQQGNKRGVNSRAPRGRTKRR
eukprot:g8674.t1